MRKAWKRLVEAIRQALESAPRKQATPRNSGKGQEMTIKTPLTVVADRIIDANREIVAVTLEGNPAAAHAQAKELASAYNKAREHNDLLQQYKTQRDKLMFYAAHDGRCLKHNGGHCSCGLQALLDQIGGKP